MKIRTRKEGGYLVTGRDYYVVRISLVALTTSRSEDKTKLDMVGRILSRSDSKEARRWADYTVQRGGQRMAADSLEKKYINVVGGPAGCSDIC